jgi:hypothetical protein
MVQVVQLAASRPRCKVTETRIKQDYEASCMEHKHRNAKLARNLWVLAVTLVTDWALSVLPSEERLSC